MNQPFVKAAAVCLLAVGGAAAPRPSRDWPVHGGEAGHTQYSPLAQIDRSNVAGLRVAWTYHSLDARPDRSQIQCNPVVVDGVLYATTAGLKAIALDAASGRELWRFDPFAAGAERSELGVNRGVVFWREGN
ncbi:MAG TPA: PQQ-binding-like beta-propeller repeat protein, partial [Vicinamibacteria bacterium]|nr:PQQ-binding-like beta-propeller repeat protein [Vicinamibacteria bacterium]